MSFRFSNPKDSKPTIQLSKALKRVDASGQGGEHNPSHMHCMGESHEPYINIYIYIMQIYVIYTIYIYML